MLQEDGELLKKRGHNSLCRRMTANAGKEVVAYLKALPQNSSGWAEEQNEKPLSPTGIKILQLLNGSQERYCCAKFHIE
jgi:hypothetical protein